ncbi:hypothetical protein Mgra_00010131 [Meloidogyne graminicola]|uniref:Uncharacterized protein n=1 Tax=Meloidogyne graminicola TaxID=189291 RepID=A0A8S9Z8D9_9BILA|nr:hypothetical protein Mgra_00010131 [Meloidogyne graminicola]
MDNNVYVSWPGEKKHFRKRNYGKSDKALYLFEFSHFQISLQQNIHNIHKFFFLYLLIFLLRNTYYTLFLILNFYEFIH